LQIRLKGQVVVGAKEGMAGVEHMFSVLKEEEGGGRWVYVVQNLCPHHVGSWGGAEHRAVVDMGGRCGGGRREWSTWVVVDVAAGRCGWSTGQSSRGGQRRGWWFVAHGRCQCGVVDVGS